MPVFPDDGKQKHYKFRIKKAQNLQLLMAFIVDFHAILSRLPILIYLMTQKIKRSESVKSQSFQNKILSIF